ncbi:predicted protein [Plenodomus lingam JN3]|uniref:Predicted protein n=1 Tax=Leptosphaeria maculans (strain JN3 / isolate v23.1.3 / race Av1-4-5-6-7-8) TaxID=985895 RepID=E5A8W3_LEPMJ|nr:predicted protein [Plenodomus lingam JN3]CBY00058.1 predicted protein [Plenodomus lingam JN3]
MNRLEKEPRGERGRRFGSGETSHTLGLAESTYRYRYSVHTVEEKARRDRISSNSRIAEGNVGAKSRRGAIWPLPSCLLLSSLPTTHVTPPQKSGGLKVATLPAAPRFGSAPWENIGKTRIQ